MRTQYVLLFPDGSEVMPDTQWYQGIYHIGESIIFQDEQDIWKIVDIQHQLYRDGFIYLRAYILLEKARPFVITNTSDFSISVPVPLPTSMS